MKKIFAVIICLFLWSSIVMAQQGGNDNNQAGGNGQGNEDAGDGQDDATDMDEDVEDEMEDTENEMEEDEEETDGKGKGAKAKNKEELQAMIQERKQEMEQEMNGMGPNEEKVFRNQNRVREAVHALLAMEDLVGGIGPEVRAVAREFNNSVQKTIKAEEKIQKRSKIKKFFAGGDEEAAEELEAEVKANKARIQLMKQLKDECECGEEVKAMYMEQIQNMEQEQDRLGALAEEEKNSRGLFGWMWK